MKNYVLIFIAGIFSFSFYAQQNSSKSTNKKAEKSQVTSNKDSEEQVTIESYDVKEKINMKFGGRTTTYNVSSEDLVDKSDLGPENTRVVTPKYVKVKTKDEISDINKLPVASSVMTSSVIKTVKVNTNVPDGKLQFTKIKIIENYERVLEKGYKTEAMLQAVADYRFFAGDYLTAAKWYSQLFEYCPDELDAVYYYRFAKSLDGIGQTEKAKEMMALFQRKKT